MITEEEYLKAQKLIADYESSNGIKPDVIKSLPSERELVDDWYRALSIKEAEILAEKYKIPRDGYAPWQMGHYEDRLRVYLGERGEGNVL